MVDSSAPQFPHLFLSIPVKVTLGKPCEQLHSGLALEGTRVTLGDLLQSAYLGPTPGCYPGLERAKVLGAVGCVFLSNLTVWQ